MTITHTDLHDSCQDWWYVSQLEMGSTGQLITHESLQIRPKVGTSKLLWTSLNPLQLQAISLFISPLVYHENQPGSLENG